MWLSINDVIQIWITLGPNPLCFINKVYLRQKILDPKAVTSLMEDLKVFHIDISKTQQTAHNSFLPVWGQSRTPYHSLTSEWLWHTFYARISKTLILKSLKLSTDQLYCQNILIKIMINQSSLYIQCIFKIRVLNINMEYSSQLINNSGTGLL